MASALTVGVDLSKAVGVSDGIGNYSRLLIAALLEVAPEVAYRLYDLRAPEIDRGRLAEVLPGAERLTTVLDGRGPAPGEVDVFLSPAFKSPPGWRGPLVFTIHDVTFVSHRRYHTLGNRVEVLTETATALAAGGAVLAVSAATRDETVRWLGVEPERITVIHSAADPAFRPPAEPGRRPPVLDRLGVDRPFLLTVGSIEPRKNLAGLLEAFAALPEDLRREHAMVVVGAAGWLNDAIHARLAELARSCRVVFAGAVGLTDLVDLYGAARAFAYPSFAEGFGFPVLEAMSCGTAVVTSNVTSLPEVAGDAAELVDPGDCAALSAALARLLGDESLRGELARRGLERARQFSWRRTAEETLGLLRRIAVS